MNCYNHNETAAVGICKHCNKGICMDCQSDTGDGIACKGRCTEEVLAINKVIEFNKTVVKRAPSNSLSAGLLYVLMGTIMLLGCVLYLKRIDPVLTSLSLIFVAYGLYVILKGRSLNEK